MGESGFVEFAQSRLNGLRHAAYPLCGDWDRADDLVHLSLSSYPGARLRGMAADVRLRDVVDEDLEILYQQQAEPEAVRRASFPARPRDAFMTHWRTRILGNPTGVAKAVVADGELAGNIVAWWQDGRRYLGYWLGEAFWGRGIGTAAVRQFVDTIETRPLYAEPHQDNTASVKLLERLGFHRVGTDDDFLVFALD